MKPEITCLQSMALKGGTAKSGSLQVKFLFGGHHFFSLPVWVSQFLHLPVLSQESRAVKGYKYQTAGFSPLLMNLRQNGYKLIWSLQWVYNTPFISMPLHCLFEFIQLCICLLEIKQDEGGKVINVMTWTLHGIVIHWRSLHKI